VWQQFQIAGSSQRCKIKLFKKQFLGYQAVNESLQWLRKTLRYGNNATYDAQLLDCAETDNPQPSS
jgi:hypothetical protein